MNPNADEPLTGTTRSETETTSEGQPTRQSGLLLIGAAIAFFVVCSLIQHAYGSGMFALTFTDAGFIGNVLLQVTFWPGWLATCGLGGLGLMSLLAASPSK